MATKPDYSAGLATVANGGTTVTFSGGANITAADIQPGDTFKVQNLDAIIATVTDATHVELTSPWTGTALVAAPYRIRYQPDGSRFTAALRDLVAAITSGSVAALQTLTGVANTFPYFTGPGAMALAAANDLRNIIDAPVYVSTRAALKSLDTTKDSVAVLLEDGRSGTFKWTSGNFSTHITTDTQEGVYINATAIAASDGAWVRQGGWLFGGMEINWFGAIGDSTPMTTGSGTDCASAVNAAVALSNMNGANIAVPALPSNKAFRLGSTISVQTSTKFIGSGSDVQIGLTQNKPDGGSWIYIDHTGDGFSFRDNVTPSNSSKFNKLQGIATCRNQPNPGVGFTPTAHGYDVRVEANVDLEDVFFLNPTKAVLVRSAGQLNTRRVRGHPLSIGIECERSSDVQRWEGDHWWPYWTQDANVKAYTIANSLAYKVRRADGLRIINPFSIWYKRLFYGEDASGDGSGLGDFRIENPYADVGGGAIEIVSNYYPAYGSITGYLCNSDVGGSGAGAAFRLRGSVPSQIDLEIRSNRSPEEVIFVDGSAHKVNVRCNRFNGWSFVTAGKYMVRVGDGALVEFINELDYTTGNGLYFLRENGGRIRFPGKFDLGGVLTSGQGFHSTRITIADDAVAILAAPTPDNTCNLHLSPVSSPGAANPAGSWWLRTTAGAGIASAIGVIGTLTATLNNTVLTGTTGTDGNVTISGASGNIYIENRSGASRSFNAIILG